jgi:hypothetical protein
MVHNKTKEVLTAVILSTTGDHSLTGNQQYAVFINDFMYSTTHHQNSVFYLNVALYTSPDFCELYPMIAIHIYQNSVCCIL